VTAPAGAAASILLLEGVGVAAAGARVLTGRCVLLSESGSWLKLPESAASSTYSAVGSVLHASSCRKVQDCTHHAATAMSRKTCVEACESRMVCVCLDMCRSACGVHAEWKAHEVPMSGASGAHETDRDSNKPELLSCCFTAGCLQARDTSAPRWCCMARAGQPLYRVPS
jgi:hypothetical protein